MVAVGLEQLEQIRPLHEILCFLIFLMRFSSASKNIPNRKETQAKTHNHLCVLVNLLNSTFSLNKKKTNGKRHKISQLKYLLTKSLIQKAKNSFILFPTVRQIKLKL